MPQLPVSVPFQEPITESETSVSDNSVVNSSGWASTACKAGIAGEVSVVWAGIPGIRPKANSRTAAKAGGGLRKIRIDGV